MKLINTGIAILYALLWVGGIANYVFFSEPSPSAAWAGPLFLLCAFLLALLPAAPALRNWLIISAAGGFLAELLGLHSGLLFGSYHYGDALGPKLLGVPLAIAFAWGVLLAFAARLAMPLSRLAGAAIGALWMVVADLLIDPLASGPLEYWQWPGGGPYFGVPLHNFLGWFIVSFILLMLLPRTTRVPRQSMLAAASIIAFYGILCLPHQGYSWLSLLAFGNLLLMLRYASLKSAT